MTALTEQQFIDISDLRSWRLMLSVLNHVMPSDAQKLASAIVQDEIDRLEPIVDKHVSLE